MSLDFQTLGSKVSTLPQEVEDAVRKIVGAEHSEQGSLVTLPLRYPSGASVVLEITKNADRCFITDMGMGHMEAELMGVSRQYARYASVAASQAGIRFDGRSIFVAEVPSQAIAGAMVVVADCSHRAVSFAAMRAAERAEADVRNEAFDRMASIFGKERIERDRDVVGASGHKWTVPLFVTTHDASGSIFEAISPHSNSVAAAVLRLHDITRLEIPPPRIVLVRSKAKMGDLIGVVSPVSSRILELKDASSLYECAVAA